MSQSTPPALSEVAREYAALATKARYGTKAHRDAESMAGFLYRTVANRAGTDPACHKMQLIGYPEVTMRWIERRGYRAAITGAGMPELLRVIIQRGEDAAIIAKMGDTLHWDGERITARPVQ